MSNKISLRTTELKSKFLIKIVPWTSRAVALGVVLLRLGSSYTACNITVLGVINSHPSKSGIREDTTFLH